jgi:class 3 adenylate cyclase
VTATPETHYVKNGDVHLAYQVSGSGPVDLLFTGDWSNHLELDWEFPPLASFLHRLGSFARLIRMNRRGVGLSDRRVAATAIEEEVSDIQAVMDATLSLRAFLLGSNEGASRAALFAAVHPDRTAGLILYAGYAKAQNTDDYQAAPEGLIDLLVATVEASWGTDYQVQLVAPGANADLRAFLGRGMRFALGPGDAAQLMRLTSLVDIRAALPSIAAPTLALHRREDPLVPLAQSTYLAEHIANARMVELEGGLHPMYLGDADAVLEEVEEFVTGTRPTAPTNRSLTTVLFTDIVDSTARAADLQDASWRTLVAEHDRVTAGVVADFGGKLVKSTGDGALATFDGPARAVRCAAAMGVAARSLDLEIRAGVHTGEVEFLDTDLAGIAVHIGARVSALADAGQVLVTSTVKELVAGSGIEFEDAGTHSLKGVPDDWHLYVVARV